jgi:transposase InsO family protein
MKKNYALALTQRWSPIGIIYYFDRGVQYVTVAYRQRLAEARIEALLQPHAVPQHARLTNPLFDFEPQLN